MEELTLDTLAEAIEARLSGINPSHSSYEQGRAEELQWVLDQINPPEEDDEDEDEDDEDDDTEVFAKPGTATATKATSSSKK